MTDDLIIDGLVAENAELQEEAEHLRSALDEAYTVIGELDDEVHQLRDTVALLSRSLVGSGYPWYQFPTVELRDGR